MTEFSVSQFGARFAVDSGILELMEDLDLALNRAPGGPEYLMLGGVNPGRIPEIETYLRGQFEALLRDGDRLERMLGIYDHPQGSREFLAAVAGLLRAECGWEVDESNIALTNGSQSSFFQLFNLFGGLSASGRLRKILLPITPEYIGYSDTTIVPDLFESLRPRIECVDETGPAGSVARKFKYHLDFNALEARLSAAHASSAGSEIGALCISRPTNPSGNVLGDASLARLSARASKSGVPLIVDCAYGLPFPGIDFTDSRPFWNPDTTVTLSLSKFGLPGVRTGIVVARPEIAAALRRMNAVMNLTVGGVGPALARDMVRSGEIVRLSRSIVAPFYKQKSAAAVAAFHELFADLPGCRVHQNEGAFFLWLWFADLPMDTTELYRRLKARGVLVVPGRYYFPGCDVSTESGGWRHPFECIRVSYAQPESVVRTGLERIAEEVRAAYGKIS